MMDALMGKKIRGASAIKCKSASVLVCEWVQNKTPVNQILSFCSENLIYGSHLTRYVGVI